MQTRWFFYNIKTTSSLIAEVISPHDAAYIFILPHIDDTIQSESSIQMFNDVILSESMGNL